MFDDLQMWVTSYGYLAVFFLLVLGIVGLPVPDETLLVLVGVLVQKEALHPVGALASAFAGAVCGISISYLIGRLGGIYVMRRFGPRFHLPEDRLNRVHAWFGRFGKWTLVAGYYIPGVRHAIALIAGASGLKAATFCLFAFSGAFLWVATFTGIGFFFGQQWLTWAGTVHSSALLAVAIVFFAFVVRMYYRWKNPGF